MFASYSFEQKVSLVAGIVGGVTLVLNIIVAVINWRNGRNASESARRSAEQAHAMAQQSLFMAMGNNETQFMMKLNEARERAEMLRVEVGALGAKARKSNEDKARLAGMGSSIKSVMEGYFNLLDLGCQQYLAGKCDKPAFKRTYKEDIRDFVKQKEIRVVFDLLYPREQSTYKDLWKVYDEWEGD